MTTPTKIVRPISISALTRQQIFKTDCADETAAAVADCIDARLLERRSELQPLHQIFRIGERIFAQGRVIESDDGVVIRAGSFQEGASPRCRTQGAKTADRAAECAMHEKKQPRGSLFR